MPKKSSPGMIPSIKTSVTILEKEAEIVPLMLKGITLSWLKYGIVVLFQPGCTWG